MLQEVSPGGYWFIDDPDDFRELEGQITEGHGFIVDELSMAEVRPNQIMKLFDLEKTRRVKCRHFNGTLPRRCPRIYCTNSGFEEFYPRMRPYDQTGVVRRQLFQKVVGDIRKQSQASPELPELPPREVLSVDWQAQLTKLCCEAHAERHAKEAVLVASELGVALPAELPEVAVDIADQLHMKPLERKRFLARCSVYRKRKNDFDDPDGDILEEDGDE